MIFRALAAATTVYMLLCTLRILLTWVPRDDTGKAGALLARAVDPWLAIFSQVRILHVGRFDFSPIASLALLAVLNQVFATLAFSGAITIGGLIALLVDALWSAVAFVLAFLAIAALARLIAYTARWNSLHPLWMVIDSMLNPVLFRITRLFWRDRIVNYLQGLVTGFAILVLLRIGGDLLIGVVMRLLRSLPF